MRHAACATPLVDDSERARVLLRRAATLRRRGELRRALLTLREACQLDESNAASWMLYGDCARRCGKREEAETAMRQALWLRQRAGDRARTQVIRRLLLQLSGS